MSDMLITMQDGSQWLAHHGVMGMHWGEWNEETRRKYLGLTSSKGDKLRKKAGKKRLEAEQARTEKAVLTRASQVHANDITKAYASANAHRIKQQANERRASDIQRRAEAERRAGNDKKADKLERKSEKKSQKAKREEDAAKRESDKGHAASNKIERHNIAVREMDARAAKLNAKAAKLEKKADKADAKQDKKVDKAANKLRDATTEVETLKGAKEYADAQMRREGPSQKEIENAQVKQAQAAHNYLVKTGNKEAKTVDRMLKPVGVIDWLYNATKMAGADHEEKYYAALDSVIKASTAESELIFEHGKAAVDLKLEKALGTKRGYRYL